MARSPTLSSGTGSSGFFGNVAESIGKGIGFVFEEIAPRWTAQQLLDQSYDQLKNPTFNAFSAPNVNDPSLSTTGSSFSNPNVKPAGLLFDNVNISSSGMLLAGVAVLGVIVLLKTR